MIIVRMPVARAARCAQTWPVQGTRLPRRSLPPRSLLALQRERETRLGFNRIIGRIADAFVGHTELEAGAVRTACGQAHLDPALDILG